MSAGASRGPIRPTEDMAADHLALYAGTVMRRFPLTEAGSARQPRFLRIFS